MSVGAHLVAKLRRLLAHVFEISLEVLLISGELVDTFEIVVAADDVVLVAEASRNSRTILKHSVVPANNAWTRCNP